MINRVLIRLKVVQVLYSHLLSDSAFSIETPEGTLTREKRFANSIYLDTLVLMVRVARNITKRGGDLPLADTPFIKSLEGNETVASMLMKYRMDDFPMQQAVESVTAKVKESAIYKNFIKDDRKNHRVWAEIYNHIIRDNDAYNAQIAHRPDFTLHAGEVARSMMDKTFSNFYSSVGTGAEIFNTLKSSLDKARELYFRLLTLPIALTQLREMDLDRNRHKYLPTAEDINPNTKFVDNRLVRLLEQDGEIQAWLKKTKLEWMPQDQEFVRSMLETIMESKVYRNYMDGKPRVGFHGHGAEEEKPGNLMNPGLVEDVEFWRDLYKYVIFPSTDFLEMMEVKSVFWNDDLNIIGEFVLKTLKRFASNKKAGSHSPVMPMYKDEEDALFGERLIEAVLKNRSSYRDMIDRRQTGSQWETDRLAFMDVVIIMTALAEIMNFPAIPLRVSINEYVQIARDYSTGKSAQFVNGLLGSITSDLHGEGKLVKTM